MKKYILFALFVLFAVCSFAQSVPAYPFTVSPLQFNGVVSKYPGGNVWLTTPVVVALPPGTTGARAYRIYTPVNYQNYNPFTFSANNVSFGQTSLYGFLQPGESVNVFVGVNIDTLQIGTMSIPIVVQDTLTNTALSTNLSLSVIDDRQYQFPSADTRVVPHIASGYGWRTLLQFTNPNNTPSVLDIKFYGSNGLPTAFRLRDGRYSANISEIVNGYGTVTLVIEDVLNKDTLVGSAEIKPILNQPVGVTIIYETTDAAAHEAALPANAVTTDTINLAYDNTNGRVTGLALLNSLNYPEPVTITYYDDGGVLLSTTTITLPAKGQTAFVINDPAIKNRTGMIRAVMPFKALSGFALRFDKDFQFIPVTPF